MIAGGAPLAALLQPTAIGSQSALEPGGPAAADIGALWNFMLVTSAVITALVFVVLAVALFRRRRPEELPAEADRAPDPRGEHANVETGGRGLPSAERPRSEVLGARWMVAGGVVLPAVVLTVLLVLTLRSLGALSPRLEDVSGLTVEVVGKQWWWEVRYLSADPSRTVTTANEIRIPVGQRVRVLVRADDVIHSFWVPGLHGKMDMIPGRVNTTWLQADSAGTWRGQCAEFCGVQHAKMAIMVVAEPPAVFTRWLAAQAAPAAPPTDSATLAAQQVFLGSGCVLCHTVRGTPAYAAVGPDLTHVASRLTLAAGELPNTRGHLYGWIAEPQALKPGSKMPAVPLTPAELHAIVRYLEHLR